MAIEYEGERSESADDEEPNHRNGTKIKTDLAGADFLQPENPPEDEDRGGGDEVFEKFRPQRAMEAFVGFFDPFQGRDHGDSRRDDAIPIE